MVEQETIEREILSVGKQLAADLPSAGEKSLRSFDDRAMAMAAEDPQLKAALFRFVDVAPACRSRDDLANHLIGFVAELESTPKAVGLATKLGTTKPGRITLGTIAANGVRHMAHRFIAGETPKTALAELSRLWHQGVATSLDLLGEATVTEAEAIRYAQRCSEALATLAESTPDWQPQPQLESDTFGPLSRINLSVKVSALTPLLRAEAPEIGKRDAGQRLRELLRDADRVGGHLHIDMESMDARDATVELILELLAEPEFVDGPSAGLVIQAYLRDSPDTVAQVLEWAKNGPGAKRKYPLKIRLVKGAYWDHELVEARQHGWPSPVFEAKAECDRNFEQLTRVLIDARSTIRVAVGSHNLRSISHAIAYNR